MEKLAPEKVKSILTKKGTELTLEETTMILEFMRKMATIVVASYLEKNLKSKHDIKS